MSEEKAAYRQIMKATSIFGGVQFFQIIIGIIRSKLIAVLLGPFGMGISGLFKSGISLISSLTNFGISTIAVKTIAGAFENGDKLMVAQTVTVFKKLVWATGLLGLLTGIVCSPYLSRVSLGNEKYYWC